MYLLTCVFNKHSTEPAHLHNLISHHCPHEETLHPWLSKMRPVKILIRLRECAGWSEFLLGRHIRMYFFWRWGSAYSYEENDPVHDETYKKTCVNTEYLDQSAHPHSLHRVFTEIMCLLQPPGYRRWINENPCHTGWMYRLICVCWVQKSFCRFCRALAELAKPWPT